MLEPDTVLIFVIADISDEDRCFQSHGYRHSLRTPPFYVRYACCVCILSGYTSGVYCTLQPFRQKAGLNDGWNQRSSLFKDMMEGLDIHITQLCLIRMMMSKSVKHRALRVEVSAPDYLYKVDGANIG